jgi:hypothetical protein
LTDPVASDELRTALGRIDPGDRALLELSLQRRIPDDELARRLGVDEGDIAGKREDVLIRMARDLDRLPLEEVHRIGAAIADLPPGSIYETDDEYEAAVDASAALHGGQSVPERKEEARAGFLRVNGLAIFFLAIFLLALGAQSWVGWTKYNNDQHDHRETGITYVRYVTSSHFGQAVTENWQSEYLQFVLYIMATVWLVQRGSPESKKLRDRGRQGEREQEMGPHARPDSPRLAKLRGGFLRELYSNSLFVWMIAIWFGSWFAQSVTGWSAYNSDQIEHGQAGTNWLGYVGSSDFWEATLQNWQSEFLAVGSMAIFAVYLRQRGSPESKPVGAPHDETASTG